MVSVWLFWRQATAADRTGEEAAQFEQRHSTVTSSLLPRPPKSPTYIQYLPYQFLVDSHRVQHVYIYFEAIVGVCELRANVGGWRCAPVVHARVGVTFWFHLRVSPLWHVCSLPIHSTAGIVAVCTARWRQVNVDRN